MNTTKDECDGWVNSKVNPIAGVTYMVIDDLQNVNLAYSNSEHWVQHSTHRTLKNVTHWRELPAPPKQKDAFEAWWTKLSPASQYDENLRFVFKDYGVVVKVAGKAIWEAAINSTKQ